MLKIVVAGESPEFRDRVSVLPAEAATTCGHQITSDYSGGGVITPKIKGLAEVSHDDGYDEDIDPASQLSHGFAAVIGNPALFDLDTSWLYSTPSGLFSPVHFQGRQPR